MNCLLDTQILIWAARKPEKLSAKIHRMLDDDANRLHVSMASLWEASIKMSLGKPDSRYG